MKFVVVSLLLLVAVLAVAGWLAFNVPAQNGNETGSPQLPHLVAVDSSGQGNHGVNQGSPELGLPGHHGTAYSFDRPGSWIQVPSNRSLNAGRGDFLVSAWLNFTDAPEAGETYDIIRKGRVGTANGSQFKAEIVFRGRVKCSAKDSDGAEAWVFDRETNVADGKWHRIECARTGSTWSVTVDRRITFKTFDLGSIGNTMPLSIGSKYGLEDAPRGRIDEVALIITKRSPDIATPGGPKGQVKRLRAAPYAGWWHLDEPASMGPAR